MAIIYQQSSPATGGWADEYYRIYVSIDELARDQAANTTTHRFKVWMVCTLGDYNDHQVALHSYQQRATRDPKALFAVGWLSATLPAEAAQCQQELGRIKKSNRFWKP